MLSKLDEQTKEERLEFLLPQHEFFHQMMVTADCESELFRDNSRGLEGGAFLLATILNRKEAKTSKGKTGLDSLKDFYVLKSDARFSQYFFAKFNFNPNHDNTPDLMRTKSPEQKVTYLHDLVAECLRDLLPFFRESKISAETADILLDHPVQQGRKDNREKSDPPAPPVPEMLEMPSLVSHDLAEATAAEVFCNISKEAFIEQFMETKVVDVSSSRTKLVYSCTICNHETKYKAVSMAHIEICLERFGQGGGSSGGQAFGPGVVESEELNESGTSSCSSLPPGSSCSSSLPDISFSAASPNSQESLEDQEDKKADFFFNYKNGEFFLDSLCAISSIYERYGDGVGCYIISKILLPIFHGLHHSNYSCSIHRFITRVLAEANPREALKLIHERFSNRVGRPAKNVFRDRRMEFRIGVTKKLIENLGPNFSDDTVKQVNHTVDIKEELYIQTRLSHGVSLRSGRHVPRSDQTDFETLVINLTDMEAHIEKEEGRRFGDIEFPENLMDDSRFDKTQFYRWVASKNEEAKAVIEAKRRAN